ncbi:MAG: hypothetical protein P4L84_03740 [Isosphaeraceae bacterium]|nr:hypothetical protein [Isosphaeraceae bacterium]
MGIVLQILGAMFLALILAIVVLFLVIRAKARRFLKTLGTMVEQAQQAAGAPARIELVPMAVNDWDDPDTVQEQASALAALGFEKAGDFEVRPVDGLRVEAWMKPAEAITAVIYEHPQAGIWTDLYTHYEDGSRITYLNSSAGGGVDHAPGHDVERLPGLDPAELYRKLLAERPQKPMKHYALSNFAGIFEKAYADDMDWRNARGGPTEREMRAVAALSGDSYSEENLEAARELLAARAAEQLTDSLREKFLAQSGMTAADWERVRDRVVIIHDRLTGDMLGDILSEYADEDDLDGFDFDSDAPARERFAAYNAQRPSERRFELLGTVAEPIEANVYRAPS